MSTKTTTNVVPVCLFDEYGCPMFLVCGHYWRRCAPGCLGWGGITLTARTAAPVVALGGAA